MHCSTAATLASRPRPHATSSQLASQPMAMRARGLAGQPMAAAAAPGASAMITLLLGDEAGDAVTMPGEVARAKSTTLAAMLEGVSKWPVFRS